MAYQRILYPLLVVLISAGLVGGVRLSLQNYGNLTRCPYLGPVALCYVVAIGYCAMLMGVLLTQGQRGKLMFRCGWIIVFLPAAIGTGLELIVGDVCPRSDSGLPLCYVSLLLSVSIGWIHTLFYRKQIANGPIDP